MVEAILFVTTVRREQIKIVPFKCNKCQLYNEKVVMKLVYSMTYIFNF